MTTVVILWHDFSGMQSRFYGTLPNQQLQMRGCQESRGAATAHSSVAGHSIFEEVLSQLNAIIRTYMIFSFLRDPQSTS